MGSKCSLLPTKEEEKIIGDGGYASKPSNVVVKKNEDLSKFKEFLARAKNHQEKFHWKLKNFNIFGHCFCHGVNTQDRMNLHKMAVELVAGIIQYDSV